MKKQKATTVREMRKSFIDSSHYDSKYVRGAYELVTELFDDSVISKFRLQAVLDTLYRLTSRQDYVIKCIYGIGRPKLTLEETAESCGMTVADVKRALTTGKKKFYRLVRKVR